MVFGGLQACSLIDFPGRISCVLFLSGCNFACPYCHNPDLARGGPPGGAGLDDDSVGRFLESRRGMLDGVVFCGGEPTIQPGLEDLCRAVRAMGYAVKLDTNGGMPGVLARLIEEKTVDYIAMDIKTDPDRYSAHVGSETGGRAVAESIRLVMESGVEYEFRTTCVRPMVNEHVIESIARRLAGADLYVLQRVTENRSLDPLFFKRKNRRIDESDLIGFKKTAEFWVKRCMIR